MGDLISHTTSPWPQAGRRQPPPRGFLRSLRPGGRWFWVAVAAVVVIVAAVVTLVFQGSSGSSGIAAPSYVPGKWTVKFNDDFTGSSLNTKVWSTGWYGSGETNPVSDLEDDCYDPSQVVQSGGVLSLNLIRKATSCDGGNDYSAGAVSTAGKYTFTYGLVEARIWVPASQGQVANWPAFWTDGRHWPADGEVDIAEGLGGQMCAHLHNSAHPSGIGPGCPSGLYAGGWHTFAVDWEPSSLTFYYDGKDIGSVTSGVTSAPMFLVLDYATGTAGGPTLAPATMKVDYVRVWQH